MEDYVISANAPEAGIRAFAITSRALVEEARARHNLSPVCTAALGRLLSGALMMGQMLKNDTDLLTIRIEGDGPAKNLTVTARADGTAKGYVSVPDVVLPANALGKLDVGGAVGRGFLRVVKDLGLKEPYSGEVELQTGEIAEDLTYYFAVSEQTPSSVGLGVLMKKDVTVDQAGGFILQLMPDVKEETIASLEKVLTSIPSVTTMLKEGLSPEDILKKLLGSFDLSIGERRPVSFRCDCSREKVKRALFSLKKEELQNLRAEEEPLTVHCHFCNTDYVFSPSELL
ncbi:MAG: Hsp33 family molecular chaperone HslO [Lachnospiraceae bacterium]|nr:Hsp33 family molecular chaperone HslO [Lachnospiraceae bacterium]